MSIKESVHQLIEELDEDQLELARIWLEDLRDAGDLDKASSASLERSLADVAAGNVKSLEQYERERGL